MKAKDIKPGMVVAWRPRFHSGVLKVKVIEPGKTEGYEYSFQGLRSQPGWRVEILQENGRLPLPKSKDCRDVDGNPVAMGRHLLGPWDEYEAAQAEARDYAYGEAVRKAAEQAAEEAADKALTALGLGALTTYAAPSSVETFRLIEQFRQKTLQQAADDLLDLRDTKPGTGFNRFWRQGVEQAATHIRPRN
jgi:hypothetical protein